MKLTPKRVAQAIGVSESSLKRWCDRGLIACNRTSGGHRRVSRTSIVTFLRNSDHSIIRPELIGLPDGIQKTDRSLGEAVDDYTLAILNGDETQSRRIVVESYLAGKSIAEIGELIVMPALQQVSTKQNGQSPDDTLERAQQVSETAISELRNLLPVVALEAPLAIHAHLVSNEQHHSSLLVELCLQEIGWNAQSLNSGLSFDTLLVTAKVRNPNLIWLVVPEIDDESEFVSRLQQFHGELDPRTTLLIGGDAIRPELRRSLRNVTRVNGLQQLRSIVLSVSPRNNATNGHAK